MKGRTTFKVAFFLKRTAMKKSGNMPILARITIDKKMTHFSVKEEVSADMWSVDRGCVLGTSAESKRINALLDTIKSTLISIYHKNVQLGVDVTAEKLKNLFFGQDDSQETLLEAFTRNNESMYKLVGHDVTMSTYRKYELAKRRVTEFLRHRYNVSDMSMQDLTLDFVKEYEVFLKSNCELSHNVAAKMILFLKRIVNHAFNNGVIATNPFASYQIRLIKVDRGYLTKEELKTMMNKKLNIKRLEYIRDIFIFCCFTGLSYIDVKQLTHHCIRETEEGDMWISTKRQKTDNKVDVLLLDIPKQIILKYRGKVDNGYVLPVVSNQKCNSYLKELADICLIDRNLTFHMASHTANCYSLKINTLPLIHR